jgi:hypothetical protein
MLPSMITSPVSGQALNVKVEVSTLETFVGVPITLYITIENTRSYVLPEFTIDGVRILPDPSPSQQQSTFIRNGQSTSQNSILHRIRLIPSRPGKFTIPALDVQLGNEIKVTQPIEVVVNKINVEPGDADKLILEIESERDTYYLGEPMDALLRIWIRPYRDQQYSVTVSRSDMWRLINEDISQWGEFSGVLQQL